MLHTHVHLDSLNSSGDTIVSAPEAECRLRQCVTAKFVAFHLLQYPHWCRWLAYLAFTQATRVRVPDAEVLL